MANSIVVRLQPPSFQAKTDGTPVQVTLQVQNAGGRVDQYRIEISDLDAEWYTLPTSTAGLFPQQLETLQLQFHPPKESARAGAYTFAVSVISRADPSQVTSVQGVLTVPKAATFDADLAPRRVTGRKGRYRLQLQNTGNVRLALEFEASDAEEECRFAFRPEDVEIEPGARATVHLAVKANRWGLIGPRKQYDFQVKVKPAGEPAKTVAGQLIHTPRLKGWRGIRRLVELALLAAVLAVGYQATGGSKGLSKHVVPLQNAGKHIACNVAGMYCPSPTPTWTPTATATATATATWTATPTPTWTATATPSWTATATPTPSTTATATPSPTRVPPTAKPPPSPTAPPTATRTAKAAGPAAAALPAVQQMPPPSH